ncbi:MAG: nucleotidyltransferase family protein [Phycisphaeraceae bacterium]
MPTNGRDIPLADTLGLLLPPPPAAALLQAALYPGDEARRAWARFASLTPEPKTFFQDDRAGVKRHLPLLHANLVHHGIAIDRALQPILRTAAVREELRAGRFRRAMHEGLVALSDADVPFVLLKGAALGETVYPSPALRHSHDVDVWVSDNDALTRAVEALSRAGFTRNEQPLADGGVRMDHASGLPIELHRRLIDSALCDLPRDEILARARPVEVMGRRVRVLDPTDALAHVVGHALFNPRRASFAWLVDAALLASRHPAIDWQRAGEMLIRAGLSLPATVQLHDLAQRFNVPVPTDVMQALADEARCADRVQRTVVVDMLRRRPQRRLIHLLGASGLRSRFSLCAALLLPPAAYVRQVEGVESRAALLACYVRRPARFAGRQMRKIVHRGRRMLRPAPMPPRTLEQARS